MKDKKVIELVILRRQWKTPAVLEIICALLFKTDNVPFQFYRSRNTYMLSKHFVEYFYSLDVQLIQCCLSLKQYLRWMEVRKTRVHLDNTVSFPILNWFYILLHCKTCLYSVFIKIF